MTRSYSLALFLSSVILVSVHFIWSSFICIHCTISKCSMCATVWCVYVCAKFQLHCMACEFYHWSPPPPYTSHITKYETTGHKETKIATVIMRIQSTFIPLKNTIMLVFENCLFSVRITTKWRKIFSLRKHDACMYLHLQCIAMADVLACICYGLWACPWAVAVRPFKYWGCNFFNGKRITKRRNAFLWLYLFRYFKEKHIKQWYFNYHNHFFNDFLKSFVFCVCLDRMMVVLLSCFPRIYHHQQWQHHLNRKRVFPLNDKH